MQENKVASSRLLWWIKIAENNVKDIVSDAKIQKELQASE